MKQHLFVLLIISFITVLAQDEKMKSGLVINGSTEIFYLEMGSGDTTFLFLHGWGINSAYWSNQIDFFSSRYKTIAIDLPGFGESRSSREDFSVEKYAEDIIDFINKKDLENIILVGHSMSGDIALEAAVRNNESIIGLVGIDNFKFVDTQLGPEQMEEMNSFLDSLKINYKEFAPLYAERYLFSQSTDIAIKSRVKNDYKNSNKDAAISSIQNVFQYNEVEKLKQLKYKLYLINSDGMPTNTAGLEKYCTKSFEVLEIKNVGHFPMIEKPDEFNQLLQQVVYKISKDK